MANAKAETVKVTFTRGYVVSDCDETAYEEGKTYELTPDSAEHFIRRGVADYAENVKADKPKSSATKKKDGDNEPKDGGDEKK